MMRNQRQIKQSRAQRAAAAAAVVLWLLAALFAAGPALAQSAAGPAAPVSADAAGGNNAAAGGAAARQAAAAGQAAAADDGAEDEAKSWVLSFIESRLSAPNRQISISGIEGALSSSASVRLISIADDDGVWMRIRDARLDWNRLSLLRGRLSVNALTAGSVEILRRPLPNPHELPVEAKSSVFTLPSLPLDIDIKQLKLRQLLLAQPLFGQAAALSVEGSLSLASKVLKADLRAERLDGNGGSLLLAAHYNGDKQNLALDLHLDEPQNGILSNMAAIEGRPALHFAASGGGEAGAWAVKLHVEAAAKPVLDGMIRLAPYAAAAEGAPAVGRPGDARVFSIAAIGRVTALLPAQYRPFFGSKADLNISGAVKQAGGLRLDRLFINGESIYLNGAAETEAGGFLRRLQLEGAVGAQARQLAEAAPGAALPDGPLVTLPLKGGAARLSSLKLNIAYGAAGAQSWSGYAALRNLQTAGGNVGRAELNIGGAAENLDDAAARYISFAAKGAAANIQLSRPGGQSSAAPQFNLQAEGSWRAGQPAELKSLALNGAGLNLTAQGALADYRFNGAARLISANISEFAALLGHNFAGSVNLGASGMAALGGAFDLNFSGGATGLRAGDNPALSALLRSDISLSGGLARNERGIEARNLRLANSHFQLFANGDLRRAGAQMDFGANLADVSLFMPLLAPENAAREPKISGAFSLRGAARGHNGLIAVAAAGGMAQGMWNGRPVRDLELSLNGILDHTSHIAAHNSAEIRGNGLIGGRPLQLAAALQRDGAVLRLDGLDLSYGRARLSGSAHSRKDHLWQGQLQLNADNIAPLAALAFMEGRGSAAVNIALDAAAKAGGAAQQNISFAGALNTISLLPPLAARGAQPWLSVGHLAGKGTAEDIFALPRLNGAVSGRDLQLNTYRISSFAVQSAGNGPASALNLRVELANGAALAASGTLSPFAPQPGKAADAAEAAIAPAGAMGHWQFALDSLTLSGLPEKSAAAMLQAAGAEPAAKAFGGKTAHAKKAAVREKPAAALLGLQTEGPARLVFNGRQLRQIEGLSLAIERGGQKAGFAQLNGRLAEPLNLSAQMQNVPLALAALIRPDLGLSGELSGKAQISGAVARPVADFEVALQNAAMAATAEAGLAPLNFSASGRTENNVLSLSAALTGSGAARQLRLQAQGKIYLAEQRLDLTAAAQDLPLKALAEMIHNPALAKQQLKGSLNAQAAISGRFADPQAKFSLNLQGFSAAALAAANAAPLNLSAAGAANRFMLTLGQLRLQGPHGLQFTAAGRLPYQGKGLDLTAKGQLPLALANGALAGRGAQLQGLLNIDAAARGALANPQMQGRFAVNQSSFVDPLTNLRLKPIALAGHLSGDQLLVDKFSAQSVSGGAIAGSGSITMNFAAGLPADLRLALNHFGYNDGVMMAATAEGGLTIRGPLLQGALIAGKITIDKAEIRVPETMSGASMLEIKNKNGRPAIITTQKRAGFDAGKSKKQAAAASRALPKLDIQISAPQEIFVRGRGLDAEMGGSLHITGPANAIKPSGGFNLIRGRLDLLTQRLIFSSGQVSLAGSFDPSLNFTATTQGDDVTVTVNVSGTPKALKISLSSDPALPQDEILARLIFKRSLSELSPLQIAQLVDAAAELSGLTHSTVMGRLRAATGLDQLDVSTDAAGNAEVSAGRYILNKVYLGVETSSTGTAKGTVNLDITPRLKARGAVGSDSNSNVGVFYERDY